MESSPVCSIVDREYDLFFGCIAFDGKWFMASTCLVGRLIRRALAFVFIVGALGVFGGCGSGEVENDHSAPALDVPPGPPDQTNSKAKGR